MLFSLLLDISDLLRYLLKVVLEVRVLELQFCRDRRVNKPIFFSQQAMRVMLMRYLTDSYLVASWQISAVPCLRSGLGYRINSKRTENLAGKELRRPTISDFVSKACSGQAEVISRIIKYGGIP